MKKKVLTIVAAILCAALLVAGSVVGTLAFLTATAQVTNVFTVGDVNIALDEALVNLDGTPVVGGDRVHYNEYHLVPGATYTKDPRITILDGSEATYVFVKIENGLTSVALKNGEIDEANGKITVAMQMENNGWVPIETGSNIYYFDAKEADTYELEESQRVGNAKIKMDDSGAVAKGTGSIVISVFEKFTVSPTATFDGLDDVDKNGFIDPKIVVTAYATQAMGFASATEAWEATFGAENGNS